MLSFIFYHHPNPISLILNFKYGIYYNPTLYTIQTFISFLFFFENYVEKIIKYNFFYKIEVDEKLR